MIPYLLHTSLLLTGCYIFYWLFIRQETFFKLNRWVLISSILLSVSIPLISIPADWSLRSATITEVVLPESISLENSTIAKTKQSSSDVSVTTIPEETLKTSTSSEIANISSDVSTLPISFTMILWYLYLIGVVVFALAFLVQLIILLTKTYTFISYKDGPYRIVELVKDEAPYSFLKSIFINPTKYDLNTYNQIINHEKIHIKQAHFFDKMLSELLLIAFWFNPFVWMLRNAITNNLEYLTDSSMLEEGAEKRSYQLSLLKVSVPQHPLNLSTNYNNSFLKSRIAMMNSKKSSARSSWKYIFLLPLIGFSMVCLNEVQSKENAFFTDARIEQSVTKVINDTEELSSPAPIEKIETQAAPTVEAKEQTENNNSASLNKNNLIVEKESVVKNNPIEAKQAHSNIKPGRWLGEINGNEVCFELNNSQPAKRSIWVSHECFDKSELSDIPRGIAKDFFIKRDAGSLKFKGYFTKNDGEGTFVFEADQSFVSYLKNKGMEVPRAEQMFHLFMNNVDKSYVSKLEAQGFKPDGKDLVELSVHGINQDKIKGFMDIFKSLDYKGYRVRDLIQFEIHDVNPEYVNKIRANGMTDLKVQDILQAKIHDVDPDFIKVVKDYGFPDVDLQDIIQFSIHDVDVEYIQSLKNLGFRDMSHRDIIQASIHDVDPDFIKAVSEAGFTDMSMQDLIQFSIHDIDARYIQDFEQAGITGLSRRELIQAAIHDVDVAFIKNLQANGMEDIDIQEVIQFSIHDVKVKDIDAFKAAGFDLDTQDIIQASIHDITPRYIEQMRALNFNDLNIEELIQAKIHGVNASFIKKARERGYNPKTLKEYIHLKIKGI